MSDRYEISVFRRKVDILMGVLTLTDAEGNSNDRWTFNGNGAISLNIVHSGSWFRTASHGKITLVGDDDRIAGELNYQAWPLSSRKIGSLRTLKEIQRGDEGDFWYVVERVS